MVYIHWRTKIKFDFHILLKHEKLTCPVNIFFFFLHTFLSHLTLPQWQSLQKGTFSTASPPIHSTKTFWQERIRLNEEAVFSSCHSIKQSFVSRINKIIAILDRCVGEFSILCKWTSSRFLFFGESFFSILQMPLALKISRYTFLKF